MSIIDRTNASKPADANNTKRPGTIRELGRSDFSTFRVTVLIVLPGPDPCLWNCCLTRSVAGVPGRRYEFVRCCPSPPF